jgi:succinate dehydrogenase / fumarate reductase, flavoprotein subunit
MSARWRRKLLICAADTSNDTTAVTVTEQPITPIRTDLLELFERSELEKYLEDDELPPAPAADGPSEGGGRS